MWRIILVTFAFLGWSFYELSGGSDYKPRTQSIQARAKLDNLRPMVRPLRVNVIRLADNGTQEPAQAAVTRSITSLADLDLSAGSRFEITLASAHTDDVALPAVAAEPIKLELPVAKVTEAKDDSTGAAEKPAITKAMQAAVDKASLANLTDQPDISASADPDDIRRVMGNVVNMRSGPGTQFGKVAKLSKGSQVIVLRDPGDGWLKLKVVETGRIGWMADRLITAAN